MPDQGAHLSLAKKNLNFLNQCELEPVKISADHPEWAITVKFYASLHMLEAILAPYNIHFYSHDKRNAKIFQLTTIFDTQFCNRYNDLYTLSKKARYMESSGG